MTAGLSAGSPLDALQSAGAVPRLTRGTVTFVAGTTGALGQHTVFTITGFVRGTLYVRCVTDLTSGGVATISVGNAGTVDALMSIATATAIDAGMVSNAGGNAFASSGSFDAATQVWVLSGGDDITSNIADATITGGSLEYVFIWDALSAGATVALGAELVAS